ncbi:MAG: Uma2 family endonuclease [Bacteroidota bacterium]
MPQLSGEFVIFEKIDTTMVELNQNISTIPSYLIYEQLDGIDIYFDGYREVLNKTKKLEEIMGYGELQWFILNTLGDFLKENLSKTYKVLTGEGGLHLGHKKNLSIDMAIFLKSQLSYKKLKNRYSKKIPQVVIEVDTKADPETFQKTNYYTVKTQQLLDFGVPMVVWLFTDSEKVTIATNDKPWITVNWSDEITVLELSFVIEKVLEEA